MPQELEHEIEIVERDEIIRKIYEIYEGRFGKEKYNPIVISSSKGMGKTFLLKKIALQQVSNKCSLIEDAKNY